jgi:flagellar basal body-associated protein FliL
MSDSNEAAKAKEPAPAKAKGGGAVGMIVGILIPGLLAAGGSFGGARFAEQHGGAVAKPAHVEPSLPTEHHPPGPTIALEPFLVAVQDTAKHSHPMKLTVAVEFESTAKEEALKPFIPRIRDAILAHMRSLTYEDAVDQDHAAKLRNDILERIKKAGASSAERILITDLVSQ